MLERKAQAKSISKDKITLHQAAFSGDIETVKELLNQKTNINEINEPFGTPLLCATVGNSPQTVKILLEHNANPDQFCLEIKGIVPLMIAAENGSDSMVKMLLEYKANPNQFDTDKGNSTLIYAARQNKTTIVTMLLEHKANPNQVNTAGTSPLMAAVTKGHKSVTKILIEHKADLHQTDKKGETALIEAIWQGCRQTSDASIVEMLLEQGANPNQADQKNPNTHPLLFLARQIQNNAEEEKSALKYKRKALFRTLFTREHRGGWSFNQQEKNIIHDEQVRVAEMVKMLLKHGANPNQTDQKGDTLQVCAARDGNKEVVKVIKEQIEKQKAYEKGRKEIFNFFSKVYFPKELVKIVDEYFRPDDIFIKNK